MNGDRQRYAILTTEFLYYKQECFGPSSDSVYEGDIGMFSKLQAFPTSKEDEDWEWYQRTEIGLIQKVNHSVLFDTE